MTELEFHRQRQMFAFPYGTKIVLGRRDDSRSHAEWLAEDFGVTEPALRGYIDDTGIYFYKGRDFEATDEDWSLVRQGLKDLIVWGQIDVSGHEKVYAGVIPGPVGTRWKGRKCLGQIGQYITITDLISGMCGSAAGID